MSRKTHVRGKVWKWMEKWVAAEPEEVAQAGGGGQGGKEEGEKEEEEERKAEGERVEEE